MKISLVAALSTGSHVIGKDNQLLWSLPNDLKRFRELTTGKPCVMGRKTWESLPPKFRPLPNRENIIFTGNSHYKPEGAETVNSTMDFWQKYEKRDEEFMIIGGSQIYWEFIDEATTLYLTYVHEMYDGDSHFPMVDKSDWEMKSFVNHAVDDKHSVPYSFVEYSRR